MLHGCIVRGRTRRSCPSIHRTKSRKVGTYTDTWGRPVSSECWALTLADLESKLADSRLVCHWMGLCCSEVLHVELRTVPFRFPCLWSRLTLLCRAGGTPQARQQAWPSVAFLFANLLHLLPLQTRFSWISLCFGLLFLFPPWAPLCLCVSVLPQLPWRLFPSVSLFFSAQLILWVIEVASTTFWISRLLFSCLTGAIPRPLTYCLRLSSASFPKTWGLRWGNP